MEISSDGGGVTNVLLKEAEALGADPLVMGAYGHSRIWEFIAGGATPDVRTNNDPSVDVAIAETLEWRLMVKCAD